MIMWRLTAVLLLPSLLPSSRPQPTPPPPSPHGIDPWACGGLPGVARPSLSDLRKSYHRASCKPLSRCSSGVAGLPFPRRCVGAPGLLQSGSERRSERRAGTASAGNTLTSPVQQNIQPEWFPVKLRYRVPPLPHLTSVI